MALLSSLIPGGDFGGGSNARKRDPGRLVIPVGSRRDQELIVITKKNGATESRVVTQCRFVRLHGAEGWR